MLSNKQIKLIYFSLAAAAVLVFWQVSNCDFINYDDPVYVTDNSQVQDGVTIDAVRWALTTGHGANWHPLTWLSHMLDVQFFGLRPHYHHLTNLFLHIINTLLLFYVLHRMTKAPMRSAFAAALFALHPLHVESVAWVSERKDVLSTFFWMLTMAAYIKYVEIRKENSGRGLNFLNFSAVIIFFILGLMSKPMLVTLPFVLVLLDYWPLGRFELNFTKNLGKGQQDEKFKEKAGLEISALTSNKKKEKTRKRNSNREVVAKTHHEFNLKSPILQASSGLRVVVHEKIPLFIAAGLSCIVTYIVQQKGGAVKSIEQFPLPDRIANTFVSYETYLFKTIWPGNLAIYYPHPGSWPIWHTVGAILLLVAVTFAVVWNMRKFPYLATGWFWFAGTLIPVIGIVQIGTQAMADRYTYVPLIGLFIMAAWGIPDLLKNVSFRNKVLWTASFSILICLSVITWKQIGYWRDSISLYDHALGVVGPDDIIYLNRGVARESKGDHMQAISDYDGAIEINPRRAEAYHNRGLVYGKLGNYMREVSDCSRAIEIYPAYADAFGHRGTALSELGNYRQAISDFDRAIELNPKLAWAYGDRGRAYGKLGNQAQAISDFEESLKLNPKSSEIYNNRGVAYAIMGNQEQAISDYDQAIGIDPDFADAYFNRGVANARLGNLRQAISDYDRAIQINPKYAAAYNNRGAAYGKLGERSRAIDDLQKAAGLGSEDAKNSLRSLGINW